jgi:hypothetical protein
MVLMPLMHQVLTEGWQRVAATAAGAGSSSSSSAGGAQPAQQQQQQKLSEEMIGETILRELSREYALLLVEVAKGIGGTSSSGGGGTAAAGRSGSGGGSSSQGGAGSSDGAGTALQQSIPGGFAGDAGSSGKSVKGVESVLETLWRYDPHAIQALMATALAGLCWPDAQSAGKLCGVCR